VVIDIAVRAAPDKGKANKELLKFLKKEWNKNFKIVKGKKSRSKKVQINEHKQPP
jgi:uncharacterized protein (TIGR00251 family)